MLTAIVLSLWRAPVSFVSVCGACSGDAMEPCGQYRFLGARSSRRCVQCNPPHLKAVAELVESCSPVRCQIGMGMGAECSSDELSIMKAHVSLCLGDRDLPILQSCNSILQYRYQIPNTGTLCILQELTVVDGPLVT